MTRSVLSRNRLLVGLGGCGSVLYPVGVADLAEEVTVERIALFPSPCPVRQLLRTILRNQDMPQSTTCTSPMSSIIGFVNSL